MTAMANVDAARPRSGSEERVAVQAAVLTVLRRATGEDVDLWPGTLLAELELGCRASEVAAALARQLQVDVAGDDLMPALALAQFIEMLDERLATAAR